MTSPIPSRPTRRTDFRAKLLLAMMLIVAAITTLGLYVGQRNLAGEVARDLERQFQAELASLHHIQAVRTATLAERCRALVRKPRIHAALEDNALDLLYPSAKDELRDVMTAGDASPSTSARVLDAEFYRFLDLQGAVISPPHLAEVGELSPAEEAQLALASLPRDQQLGYLVRATGPASQTLAELIALPIVSTETEEGIAALVLGFKPVALGGKGAEEGIRSGIWLNGQLHLPSLPEALRTTLGSEVARAIASGDQAANRLRVEWGGRPHLLFFKRLNPDSLYPSAYEVCMFPLTGLLARQRQLRWEGLGAGALMLLVGFFASHYLSAQLSVPVEKLAVDSEANRAHRERAESALEQTHVELQRSVRFSADASHQLKTPVTVLRSGLEEMLVRDNLGPEMREEISGLVHQTYRLTSVIEDLLLLSRMDAGRLQLEFAPIDLSGLLEAELDDLSAQPDPFGLEIRPDIPTGLQIAGEKRFTTLIVRNLLENAGKYNCPGGRISVRACAQANCVLLTIGNTGRPIPAAAQPHIFERFHRGSAGENVPGHGLGLDLARELARLHGGEVRLTRSDQNWTEFEVRFLQAAPQHSRSAAKA